MPYCIHCGTQHAPEARFCQHCGTPMQEQTQRATPPPGSWDPAYGWLTMREVINTRDRQIGAIGTVLAFVGAFMPWSQVTVWFYSQGVSSPMAWLIALAAIAAGACLFRPRTGTIVMGIGIGTLAITVVALMGAMSNSSSPLVGVFITLIGGGMLGYSGYLTNQYERGN